MKYRTAEKAPDFIRIYYASFVRDRGIIRCSFIGMTRAIIRYQQKYSQMDRFVVSLNDEIIICKISGRDISCSASVIPPSNEVDEALIAFALGRHPRMRTNMPPHSMKRGNVSYWIFNRSTG